MKLFKNLFSLIVSWLTRAGEPKEQGLSDFERVRLEIKPCDVLLVQGRSRADKVIQSISQSIWSRSALYIGRPRDVSDQDLKAIIQHFYNGPSDTPLLLESKIGEGICIRPLLEYEHEHIRICRPKSLGETDVKQIIRFGVNRLGSNAGGYNTWDLLRFFFPWSLVPFSWRRPMFRHWAGRNTRNVTAAFVAECFGFIQFPIYPLVKTSSDQGVQLLRRHPKLCLPNEIDLSPSFEVVKYPFIDFRIYENERLIPWKGSGIYTGMEQGSALVYQSSTKKLESNQETEESKVTPINSRPE